MPNLTDAEKFDPHGLTEFMAKRQSAPPPVEMPLPTSLGESSYGSGNSDAGPSTSSQQARLRWFEEKFRPHFDSWVFGPIDRLVHSEDALVGFIMMTCAIDYLAGFWWGESTRYTSKKAYIDFIDQYFPKDRYSSSGLYDSLRNGLVHMFTIKGKKYALVHNKPELHLRVDDQGQTILNAGDFRDDLKEAKDEFFDEVQSSPDRLKKLWERYDRDGFLGPAELRVFPMGIARAP